MRAIISKTDYTIKYLEMYLQRFEKKLLQISEILF